MVTRPRPWRNSGCPRPNSSRWSALSRASRRRSSKRRPLPRVAEKFLERLRRWADAREEIRAVVVVGSFARGEARPDSDVDVVLLASEPSVYISDTTWVSTFGSAKAISCERYGRVTAVRVFYGGGLEVEFGIAPADWASAPVDPGTEEVSRHRILVLLDRDGDVTALRSGATGPTGQ
ncbi:MAG: hypothetical protein C5B48_16295 [Candidatus Rokuibacteriota bacterium]|nr:MAG: hypothetical protein C5B48_16295 [Candidatus Rokubacteria bacterium]